KNCTAWQIAMMNSEFKEAEVMGAFMTQEEKERQFFEIFPKGEIEKYDWDLNKAKQLLEAVFNAVKHDSTIQVKDLEQMNETTRKALQELYDYVKPAAEHNKGLVFDENCYVAALELLKKCPSHELSWSKCTFWAIRVEEYLASLLGTAYLRALTQGAYHT